MNYFGIGPSKVAIKVMDRPFVAASNVRTRNKLRDICTHDKKLFLFGVFLVF
jgi:hypothetical protein